MKSRIILIATIVISVLLLFSFFGCIDNKPTKDNNIPNSDKNTTNPAQPGVVVTEVTMNKFDVNFVIEVPGLDRWDEPEFKYNLSNYSLDLTSNKNFSMKTTVELFDDKNNFVDSKDFSLQVKNGRQMIDYSKTKIILGSVKKRGVYSLSLKGYNGTNKVIELTKTKIFAGQTSETLDLNAKMSLIGFEAAAAGMLWDYQLGYKLTIRVENSGNAPFIGYTKTKLIVDETEVETWFGKGESGMTYENDNTQDDAENIYVGIDESTKIKNINYTTEYPNYPSPSPPLKAGQKVKLIISLIDRETGQVITTAETEDVTIK